MTGAGGGLWVPYRKVLRSLCGRYFRLLHIGVLDEGRVVLRLVVMVRTALPHTACSTHLLPLSHFVVVLVRLSLRLRLLTIHLLLRVLVIVLMLVIGAGIFWVMARAPMLVVMLLWLVHYLWRHVGGVQIEGLLLSRGREVLSIRLIRMHPVLLLHLRE